MSCHSGTTCPTNRIVGNAQAPIHSSLIGPWTNEENKNEVRFQEVLLVLLLRVSWVAGTAN